MEILCIEISTCYTFINISCNAFATAGCTLHKRNNEGSWFHCINGESALYGL
jgi:hypothetical protein